MAAYEGLDQKVILIEDDAGIGARIRDGLQANGFLVRWCRTGHSGLAEAQEKPAPDVVLIDLGLPDVDGIDIARTLRSQHPGVVMIAITAMDRDIDIVAGLDAGADDYLTKPFSISVLLARLRAQLRRLASSSAPSQDPVIVGALSVDPAARRCHLGDVEIELRPKEFDLLLALARKAGSAITRDQLMREVWDEHWHGSTKTLDVTLAALRRQLSLAAQAHAGQGPPVPVITTLRGHGYRLETETVPLNP
jgi:DNA-binding response OmpR family regulator